MNLGTWFADGMPAQEMVPLELFSDNPLSLGPEHHPNGQWSERHANYNNWWAYYKGYVLNERINKDRNAPLVFPMKLNMVRSAAILHAAATLGQYRDHIIQFGIGNDEYLDDEVGKKATSAMNLLWKVNTGDAMMPEQALFQQIFGGFFFKVAWTPQRKKWGLRYFAIDPRAVFPIYDGHDYDRLVSVDMHYQIPKVAAQQRYGISKFSIQDAETANYHEHWDEQEYFIEIDGKIATWPDGTPMSGKNPFVDPLLGNGIVPVVYAPRIRIGEFYGESLVPGLIGPQDEINTNVAHLSDGLAESMHLLKWVRNFNGKTDLDTVPRDKIMNIGSAMFDKSPPEIGALDTANFTDPAVAYGTENLTQLMREYTGLPDVAWGRSDSSIRSALTLAFLLKPLTDHGLHYRTHAARALKQLNHVAFVMAIAKGMKIGNEVPTVDMLESIFIAHKTSFSSPLPQDRAEAVNEVVQRYSSGIMSLESAIGKLDGPDDLEEEIKRIKAAEEEKL